MEGKALSPSVTGGRSLEHVFRNLVEYAATCV